MLMADDGSNLWSFDDFTAADDDMHLSMDVQSFLDILEESPNPSQNYLEDATLKNVPQDDSTSVFGGNNSLIRSGVPVLEVASSSGAEILGSANLSPSYNSEMSESRTGGSDGSFDSVGNSLLDIDCGKFEPSAHVGSPLHSRSGSLADWIPPTLGHDTTPAERDGIAQNALSCGRYREGEIQLKMPSRTPFSFSAADSNHVSENREALNFNHLDRETESHFKGLGADTRYKYVPPDPSMDNRDVNYGNYCDSSENSSRTSGIPDIMEPSIIYVDASMHNAYYSSSSVCEIPDVVCGTGDVLKYCMTTDNTSFASPSTQYLAGSNNFQLFSNDDEMMINMKDEVVELPTRNACLSNTMILGTHVGRVRGTVSQSQTIGNSNIGELSSERYGSNHTSPSFLLNVPIGEEATNVKDKRNDELIPPQTKLFKSSEFIDDDISQKVSGPLICGILADKSLRHSFYGTLSPISIKKPHEIHAMDEKEDVLPASKRPCHSLDIIDEYVCKNPTLVGDHDQYLDVQTLKDPCVQPSASFGKQLGYTKDGNEITLSQPKIIGSRLLKGSCQAIQSSSLYHGSLVDEDDDSDICILEDISEPARPNKSLWNRNSFVTSQHSNLSDPFQHMGVGGVRNKTNDERLIFQVAMQDLSQTKSEASPPDGVLAVPLLRHQRIALSWMVQKETAGFHCSGGILADDQGLGKTVSTIALILKERSPSSILNSSDVKQNGIETLNLDEDDDTVFEVNKQEADGSSVNSSNHPSVQTRGRLAAGTLVVCPTSVLRQWAEELHNKVTSKAKLSVLVYHGSNRTKDPLELAKFDVVVTTYSIVSMEVPKQPVVDKDDDETGKLESHSIPSMELLSSKKRKSLSSDNRSKKNKDSALPDSAARPLARVGWFRVVLDEAQSIKNYRTQVARACWGLRAKRRWCLSGTPIQNAVDDLYSYFRFLRYDPYAVYKSFCSTIKVPISKDPAKGYRKLQAVLKTIMLRRTKGTLLDGEPIISLPPKSIELKRVDFTDEERDFYCRLEADSRAQFAEYAAAGTVKENYVNILLMLLRLRQACDHPLLVKGYDSSCAWKSSVKMAKKLPQGKLIYLLNCLEASLAICGICNDPPEDAVVTRCGHVFCNQCICEHLTGDDSECPSTDCKAQISVSSVFSRATLRNSLSGLPGMDHIPDCTGPELDETVEPCSRGSLLDSSKIKAALEVLQALSKPQDCALRASSLNFIDESSSSQENSIGPHSEASLVGVPDQRNLVFDKDSKGSVKVMGDKAIVFSQWTGMLDLLEACLKNSSIKYRRLDGTMSVIARDKAVKDFNTLPEVSVMIMSLKAASLGLNMVAACHVLLLDLWWNPTTEDQAIDRAHRIGQTRPVTVLRLTVKDTVEDRILALQQKKREMVASAFGEDETGSRQSRLTTEDLKYLFMA